MLMSCLCTTDLLQLAQNLVSEALQLSAPAMLHHAPPAVTATAPTTTTAPAPMPATPTTAGLDGAHPTMLQVRRELNPAVSLAGSTPAGQWAALFCVSLLRFFFFFSCSHHFMSCSFWFWHFSLYSLVYSHLGQMVTFISDNTRNVADFISNYHCW
jgi:hypothetical protein